MNGWIINTCEWSIKIKLAIFYESIVLHVFFFPSGLCWFIAWSTTKVTIRSRASSGTWSPPVRRARTRTRSCSITLVGTSAFLNSVCFHQTHLWFTSTVRLYRRFVRPGSSRTQGQQNQESVECSRAEECRLASPLQPWSRSAGRQLQETPQTTLQQVSAAISFTFLTIKKKNRGKYGPKVIFIKHCKIW